MLVSHIQHLMREEGVTDFREAVERGAHERLVPILMTAMAAGLALVPLALGGGKPGSEIQTPMAIVILCGLTTSTLLNMFVVPTLYLSTRPFRAISCRAGDVGPRRSHGAAFDAVDVRCRATRTSEVMFSARAVECAHLIEKLPTVLAMHSPVNVHWFPSGSFPLDPNGPEADYATQATHRMCHRRSARNNGRGVLSQDMPI
jgi:hypothetical protein